MAVEYGIGVTNRFAFLHDDEELEIEKPIFTTTICSVSVESERGKKAAKGFRGNKSNNILTPKNVAPTPVVNRSRNNENDSKYQKIDIQAQQGEKSEFKNSSGQRIHKFRKDQLQSDDHRHGRSREDKTTNVKAEKKPELPLTEMPERDGDDFSDMNQAEAKDSNQGLEDVSQGDECGENAEQVAEKTLTLKEWKAMQEPREKPKFNTRKPGEGEDVKRLGKLTLKKKDDEIEDKDEEYEVDEAYYPQRAGKFKPIADVGFTTGYQRQRRGGRIAGKGQYGAGDQRTSEENFLVNRGRGQSHYRPRGGQRSRLPRIDDAFDFPSLG